MASDLDVLVSLVDTDTATANQLAGDLHSSLLDEVEVEAISRVRDDPSSPLRGP